MFKMLDKMGTIDFEEKKNEILSYLKYAIFLLPIIPIILIISYYTHTYGDTEDELVKLAQKYINNNHIEINDEIYIPLGELGEVDGAELCSNASGVIVTKKGNKNKYTPYLKCLDYETKLVSNSDKYISLSGDEITILNYGEIYEEKGYFSEDVIEVTTNGEVKSAPGIYTIYYDVKIDGKIKDTLIRKVIITKYDKTTTNSGATSSDKPTLTLKGDTTMILERGEKYVEPGYRAVDYKDGKISRKVERTDDVNTRTMTKKIGTYVLVYKVTNSRGISVVKGRTIKVVNKKSDMVVDSLVKKVINGFAIDLKITGTGYSHTILPNGERDDSFSISYPVKQNGTYKFAFYDTSNNVVVREVDVNDVDITPPTVSCVASVSKIDTNVYVTASDKSGIKGYNYIIDGRNYSSDVSIKESNYKIYQLATDVSVQVQDTYGNISSTVKCNVNNISNRGTMTNGIMNIPLYLQTNYKTPIKWGNGKTTTVSGYGCGPTSVSMVIAYLTGNTSQNPQNLFEWLNSLGYFHGNGFGKAALTKAAAKYGVTCEWVNLTETSMKETLLSGKPIIAFMGKGQFSTGGHYIVLKGVDSSGKIAVNDPFYTKNNKQTFAASLILQQKRVSKAFAVCN